DQVAATGVDWSDADEAAFRAPVLDRYAEQGSPYYSTARLWDDGVIDPADTRMVLGLGLSVAANAPLEPIRYGVFRM
ncbi:carboxyl transferase domain-containing protein, partial [Candidatus Frankia alpina]